MRPLLLVIPALGLCACASPLPAPDPDQAWVDLRAEPRNVFMAQRLDERRLDDGRFFQVPPGEHRLEASYEYEVTGGGSLFSEPQFIRCRIVVDYDAFRAGERYRLEARALGFTPQVRLKDAQGQVVAEGERSHCF